MASLRMWFLTDSVTLTNNTWDSRHSIAAFAGAEIDQAVFYPEDDKYLVARETTVKHFTVH